MSGNSAIKAIIFDYGGVVLPEVTELLYRDIAQAFGLKYKQVDKAIEKFSIPFQLGQISEEEFWQKFSRETGKKLPSFYRKLWLRKFVLVKRDKRILSIIKKLKARGYQLAVLSNCYSPHAKFGRQSGKYDEFEVVILSCEIGLRKPEPQIYKLVAQKLRLKSADCLFLDDRPENLVPAQKLGMKTILYQNPRQLLLKLRQLQVRI